MIRAVPDPVRGYTASICCDFPGCSRRDERWYEAALGPAQTVAYSFAVRCCLDGWAHMRTASGENGTACPRCARKLPQPLPGPSPNATTGSERIRLDTGGPPS